MLLVSAAVEGLAGLVDDRLLQVHVIGQNLQRELQLLGSAPCQDLLYCVLFRSELATESTKLKRKPLHTSATCIFSPIFMIF